MDRDGWKPKPGTSKEDISSLEKALEKLPGPSYNPYSPITPVESLLVASFKKEGTHSFVHLWPEEGAQFSIISFPEEAKIVLLNASKNGITFLYEGTRYIFRFSPYD